MYKYFPHTEADISEMLGKIGLSSLDELYAFPLPEAALTTIMPLRLSANSSPVRNTSRPILPISPKFLREHYNIYSSFKA